MRKLCYITTIALTQNAFIKDLAIYLAEHGDFDITLICNPDEEFEAGLPENIHFIPVKMKRGLSFDGLHATRELLRIFKKEKFDYVQYSTPNAALYASIASWLARVPIRNYHLMGFRYLGFQGFSRKIFKTIERISCMFSNNIECVSKSNMKLGIEEKIFAPEKVEVIWNGSSAGIDLQKFDIEKKKVFRERYRQEFGYKDSEIVFCFAGRITKDKGIEELLQAFEQIEDERGRLLLVGNDEGIETLNAEIYKKSKINPRVKYHEFVKDIVPVFSAIDVLVLPSYREGFGNIIIEAQAMGVPVIVSNIPGPTDAMVENNTGFIVDVKSVESLKAAMIKLLCNDNLREEMGMNGIEFVKNSFDQKKLFQKILNKRKSI